MSDIVIKNPPFDFPDGCYGCPFLMGRANCKCLFMDKTVRIETIREEYEDEYLEGCPIKELPPHGRLIDADQLKKKMGDFFSTGSEVGYMWLVDDAPVILEASKED